VRDHLGDRRPDREVSRLTPRREFEAISQGCRGLRPSCPRPLPRAVSVGERFAPWRRHACAMPRLPSAAAHARITAVSRTRGTADTGGHTRTRRRSSSSTGGTLRTPQDTRGHGITPVRDREAPGSNPGAPDQKSYSNSRSSPAPSGAWGSQGGHRFSWNWVAAARSKWISNRQLTSLTAIAQPLYQHAHGPRAVRHLGSKIKGAVHAGVLPTHKSGP